MVTPELLDYIKQFLAGGQSPESVKKILMGTGWAEADIDEAMKSLGGMAIAAKQEELLKSAGSKVVEVTKPTLTRHFSKTLFSLIVVGFCLIGGGVYAYFYLGDQPPEKIYETAIDNLQGVRSLRYDTKVRLAFEGGLPGGILPFGNLNLPGQELQGAKKPVFSLSLDVGGSSHFRNQGVPDTALTINGVFSGSDIPETSLSLEVTVVGKIFYLKLSKLSGKVDFLNLDLIKDQWLKIDPSEFGGVGSSTGPFDLGVAESFSSEQQSKVQELIKESRFFLVQEELASESVGDQPAYHYRLHLDRDGLRKFLIELTDILKPADLDQMSTEDLAEAKKNLSEMVDQVFKTIGENVDFTGSPEIWISKQEKLPLRILLDLKIEDKNKTGELNFNFDTLYSRFNELATIEEPAGAKSLVKLIEEVNQGRGSGLWLWKTSDDRRVEDLAKIQADLKLYHNKCGFYPGPVNCIGGFKRAPVSWEELKNVLEESGIGVSATPRDPNPLASYFYGSDGKNYILGAELEDSKHPALTKSRLRGSSFGVDCNKSTYCVFGR